jgi:hypothetical protein
MLKTGCDPESQGKAQRQDAQQTTVQPGTMLTAIWEGLLAPVIPGNTTEAGKTRLEPFHRRPQAINLAMGH